MLESYLDYLVLQSFFILPKILQISNRWQPCEIFLCKMYDYYTAQKKKFYLLQPSLCTYCMCDETSLRNTISLQLFNLNTVSEEVLFRRKSGNSPIAKSSSIYWLFVNYIICYPDSKSMRVRLSNFMNLGTSLSQKELKLKTLYMLAFFDSLNN